jgi:nucleoside-diphosphate-sugar epimerase
MAEPATNIPKGSWVLVTGANGFVASHVAQQFLQRGYKVRGTIRDLEKSSWLTQDVFKSYTDTGDFELVVVPDLAVPGAFDSAIKGVSIIVHAASVVTFSPDANEVIPQTVSGATSILYAALKEPSVRAFVYTGSIAAAVLYGPAGGSVHVERDTWNEAAVKIAWAPPPYESSRSMHVYQASKTEAEKAVFKFLAEKNPHFSVNSVDPSSIMGEALNKKHLETPYSYLKVLNDGHVGFLAGVPSSKYPYFYSAAIG